MRSYFPLSLILTMILLGIKSGAPAVFPAQTQEQLPSVAEILDRFIQVTGGQASYEMLKNQVIAGSVEFVEAGIKGKTSEYRAAPNKAYRIVELPGVGKIEAGSDGFVAWELSSETGARIKAGEEGAAALREANFNAPLRWRELYSKVECTGRESIENQTCYKVVLTPKNGKPIYQYYDVKTGLIVKIAMTSLTPTMGEVAAETWLSDYRSVQGILVAHQLKRRVLSQLIETKIESVQFNVEISEDRFDLPPAIKALAGKK